MTVTGELSLPVLILNAESFIIFSLPCLVEEGNCGVAVWASGTKPQSSYHIVLVYKVNPVPCISTAQQINISVEHKSIWKRTDLYIQYFKDMSQSYLYSAYHRTTLNALLFHS